MRREAGPSLTSLQVPGSELWGSYGFEPLRSPLKLCLKVPPKASPSEGKLALPSSGNLHSQTFNLIFSQRHFSAAAYVVMEEVAGHRGHRDGAHPTVVRPHGLHLSPISQAPSTVHHRTHSQGHTPALSCSSFLSLAPSSAPTRGSSYSTMS